MTNSELVVADEDTGSWFKAIGADENVPALVQTEIARLFVHAIADDAEEAQIETVQPRVRLGQYGLLIPKTKINVRLRGIHKDAAVLFVALLATAATHGAAAPVALPAAASLWSRVSRLTSDQRAMLAHMQHVAEQQSLSMHEDWIPQADIMAAWPTAKRQQGLRLLADLQEAGAITGTSDEWKVVL